MSDDFIDFSYEFIYECANLINNLYDYNDYYHLVIKLCSKRTYQIVNIFNRYFGMYNYKTQ